MKSLKLGKLPPKHNFKTLLMGKYLEGPGLDAPPPKVWREYKIHDWQMFGNDSIGNCTCAAIAHMLMLVTAHTGKIVVPELADVISAYSAVSGYDPKTGINDNGAAITDVLNYWQTVGLSGHKILGWAEVDHSSHDRIKQGVHIFGGVDLGVELTQEAMDQFEQGQSWQIPKRPVQMVGGHSIPNFGYGSLGTNCITWGQRQGMSWEWFDAFCDEAYVVITKDWVNEASGLAPNMLNMDRLIADLKQIAA